MCARYSASSIVQREYNSGCYLAEMGVDIASTGQSYLAKEIYSLVCFFFGLSALFTLCPLRCFYVFFPNYLSTCQASCCIFVATRN